MSINHPYSSGWRDNRRGLRENSSIGRFLRRALLLVLCSGSVVACLFLLFFAGTWLSEKMSQAGNYLSEMERLPDDPSKEPAMKDLSIDPKDLDLYPSHLSNHFTLKKDGVSLTVESSLDPGLQDYILKLFQRSGTLKAAAVILRPDDGRILAMVSYDKDGNGEDLCLKADFPAASLFKIVAAAAALESAGFTAKKPVYFVGNKHTLYKRQLKQNVGRHASKTSFKRAFASSINPVFGRLGIYDLGQKLMADSAERFLFNRSIPFDLPVAKSSINVPEDDFGLAEIASGFNKDTMISPMHAALLASTVANNGVMMKPWLIESISREDGKVVYQGGPEALTTPISRDTAEELRILMKDTVLYGTCRKSLRRLLREKTLRKAELGAKTGTINDETDRFKFDWLAAYVLPPNGAKGICVAILGVHGKRLGIRANRLAGKIISYYFSS